MKLTIKSEQYGITPAPKLNKVMFDWLWGHWWKVRNHFFPLMRGGYSVDTIKNIETIEIRINQALEWTDVHFYITINGIHKLHLSAGKYEFKKYQIEKADMNERYGKGVRGEHESRKHSFEKWIKDYL